MDIEINRHEETENNKKSLLLLLLSWCFSSASKPVSLCCALGLINMIQTVNDQREWEISKG